LNHAQQLFSKTSHMADNKQTFSVAVESETIQIIEK